MSMGLFGDMFDFNGDGQLDAFEQATEFLFFQEMIKDKDDEDEEDDEG